MIDRKNNRNTILTTALTLFSDRGYDGVGIREICEIASITKPTLYHYFGNKSGLLKAILEHYFEILICEIDTATSYTGDLTGSLRKVVETYFNFFQNNPLFYGMQLGMIVAPPQSEAAQAVAPYYKKQYQLIEELFIDAVTNHGNLRDRERYYAISLIGTINTYITATIHGHTPLNDQLLYRVLHQFEHGIYS